MIAQLVTMMLTLLVSNGTCALNGYNAPNLPGGLSVYTCVGPQVPVGPVLPPRSGSRA